MTALENSQRHAELLAGQVAELTLALERWQGEASDMRQALALLVSEYEATRASNGYIASTQRINGARALLNRRHT